MRNQLFTAAAALLIAAAAATAQTPTRSSQSDDEQPSRQTALSTSALVGTWKSSPDEVKLTSDFDRSVWGADATSVREVELMVERSGEATLKVTKKVVDAEGRTVPASTWVEEVRLQIGAGTPGLATRVEHDTRVVSAVRLFPDDPDYRWEMDGLRVKVVTFTDGDGSNLEIRYDTPEGRGSFWEMLRREGGALSRRAAR